MSSTKNGTGKPKKCLMLFDWFHCSVENLWCGHRFPWSGIHTDFIHPFISLTQYFWITCCKLDIVLSVSDVLRELTLLSLEQTNTEIQECISNLWAPGVIKTELWYWIIHIWKLIYCRWQSLRAASWQHMTTFTWRWEVIWRQDIFSIMFKDLVANCCF